MASAAPDIPVLARDQAFENLYRQYVRDVYHYALALLRNPADAEDVTQTTFLNAYRAFARGDEIRKPQNWLIKIAHNVARSSYARASRRVKEVPLEDHLEYLALPEPDRPDIEAVLRALGRLPFNQRAALVMRELDGYSYAEIADTLGVSVSAVETLIFRARRSLRLRASSLRSLGLVPLPASLAHLFGGGVIAAGGGAVTGLFAKAMLVLVVGSAATGIGGDGGRSAAAAGDSVVQPAVAAPGLADATAQSDVSPSATLGSASTRHATEQARANALPARIAQAGTGLRTATKTTATASSAPWGTPAAPKVPVTTAATGVVQVVEETAASAPTVPLPPVALPPVTLPPVTLPPVTLPSPPPLPVEVPKPPVPLP
jgi:RNA polymerase sigma factor (sigma-70 family)